MTTETVYKTFYKKQNETEIKIYAAEAEHATNADNATNATNATNAINATTAEHATNATNATTADNANKLGGVAPEGYLKQYYTPDTYGLKPQQINGDTQWGNGTGWHIAEWTTEKSPSCAFKFRGDNPSTGKMSMLIDGTVYVNEGDEEVATKKHVSTFLDQYIYQKIGTLDSPEIDLYIAKVGYANDTLYIKF